MRLWYHLRAHRFLGLKFKRQKPIGPYIVDFACPALRLVIEIDGGQHSEEAEYDRRRDAWLHKRGYTVLRFWNNEVMENMEGVLERIVVAVRDQAPSPPSLPAGVHELPVRPFDGANVHWTFAKSPSHLPQAGEGSINPSSPLSKPEEGYIVSPSPPSKAGEGSIEMTLSAEMSKQ